MSDKVTDNLKENSSWMRVLYTILFVIVFNIVEIIIAAVVVFQLLVLLFTGQKNPRLVRFGSLLSQYAYRVLQYMTLNTDEKPFPFADWESEDHLNEIEQLPGS
jgi:hypothetical protein